MGRKIEIYVTDNANKKFLEKGESLYFKRDKPGYRAVEEAIFNIYDQVRYQEILGFGGAFTQASAVNLMRLDRDRKDEIMQSYFDRKKGIGYSFCRATINSCDFSTESYSYDDVEGDFELKYFNIEHDRKDVIPIIQEAKAFNKELQVFSSPWSPPYWMKTNNRMDKGGYLRKDCMKVWADYFVRYLQEYEKCGINIYGVTVQNETKAEMGWESCFYTSEEERIFVSEYLRPALNAAGMEQKKIFFWDHNKERAMDRCLAVLSDEKAKEAFDGIAVHWYAGDHFGALDGIHRLFPNKTIIGTEACVGIGERAWYDTGEKYAHDIIGDLNSWANAWVDWNMVLDHTGMPDHWREEQLCFREKYEQGLITEDNMSPEEKQFLLNCIQDGIWTGEAPVMVNYDKDETKYNSSYYYIGHFSKFIRPGAVRIGSSIYTKEIEVTVFQNPDGEKVAVAMNDGDEKKKIVLRFEDEIAEYYIEKHSIVTFLIQ